MSLINENMIYQDKKGQSSKEGIRAVMDGPVKGHLQWKLRISTPFYHHTKFAQKREKGIIITYFVNTISKGLADMLYTT